MFATVGALVTGAVYECADESRRLTSNPVEDCIRPLLDQLTSYLCSAALASRSSELGTSAVSTTPAAKQSASCPEHLDELWYRGPDFERFKHDLVAEARDAGFFSPETQYAHIKHKYIDEKTRRNTAENLKRGSAETLLQDCYDATRSPNSARTKQELADSSAGGITAVRKKMGHRRSVSFDLMQKQPLLGLPPLNPKPPSNSALASRTLSLA